MLDSYKQENNYATVNPVSDINAGLPYKQEVFDRRKSFSGEIASLQTKLNNRLLSALPDVEFIRLLPFLQTVSVSCGENIFYPDSVGKFVYFPETAVFSQLNILEDGRTIETAMIGGEGIAGIASILSFQSAPFWIQTSIAGNAFRIGIDVFKREFNRGGFLQTAVFNYLNSYIAQIAQKVICSGHHHIEERFSTWLLMLEDRSEAGKISLTHEQIAYFLGVHRPSITCIAQNLRRARIIDYVRGKISIVNRQKLKNLACECYSAANCI